MFVVNTTGGRRVAGVGNPVGKVHLHLNTQVQQQLEHAVFSLRPFQSPLFSLLFSLPYIEPTTGRSQQL